MKSARFLAASALATSIVFLASPAFAQTADKTQPPKPEAKATEVAGEEQGDGTIIVTGSRIPQPEFDGVLPGVSVSKEQVSTRGFTNALEILNDLPLVGPGSSPLTGNNGGQSASLGNAFVDLLDLGTPRTLTLVNGRRYVSGNAATLFVDGNATGSQVDANTIPAALVSRVDVVTVGGAAAYGADAIAGVVNYILKDDYKGVEIKGLAGLTSRKDAAQFQISALAGTNLLDGRINITVAGEYDRNEGLQADSRDFRLRRAATITNFANGARRNPAFGSAIIDVAGANNGAFLRSTDDGVPATAFFEGFVNQTLSFNGTILNTNATPAASYTPLSQVVSGVTRTSNFIVFDNGVGTTGNALTTPLGNISSANLTFFNTATQLVNGLPGATLISGNGLNGRPTPPTGLTFTTFAPTALPAGVTSAAVLTQFGIATPAGATAAQLTTLAVNTLQANRPTAREFFTANPNTPTSYFIGTFIPNVPRVANTDTTLVTVAGVQVPINQVLPFVAVPLEFTADGNVRPYTAATLTPSIPGTIAQAPGSNGGFNRSIENIVLRTQQDRYIANLNAKFEVSPNVTFFTENLFARVRNVALRNSPSQNFVTTGAENAALVLNVNNPYLDAGDIAALNAVGINAATRGGTFALTRQNQDIFGDNPAINISETYRILAGVKGEFNLFGRKFNAELAALYGHSKQNTKTTQINDIEYQLALDAVRDGSGTIRCRSQLFPAQYLGRTPVGTVANLTRQPGADGIPTEVVVTPTITQAQIDGCSPLNPFGFNQLSAESKRYVRQDVTFTNTSTQKFIQAALTGSLFDLPAGPLGISANIEYREDSLDFRTSLLNQLGRGRSAPSAQTAGEIRVIEGGGEARIPIFGEDFLPFFGSLEINPGIRISQQSGEANRFRNLAGTIVTPTSKGDAATIWSIAGTWRPIKDISFRGNITRSVRQPSIVELFLGGQPAFATPTDPCSTGNIASGSSATNRRANCRAAVVALGLAADATAADTFLAGYVPQGIALPGSFSGAAGLSPERGNSWTAGTVLTPRWIPGLSISADYIRLNLKNIIQPTNLAQALQFCYDSATFPDTSPQTGANTCAFFTRAADFQVAPGFASGFINLSATQLRALNVQSRWKIQLPKTLGTLLLRGSVYHLIKYTESAAGDFSDAVKSAGTFNRPKWEVQTSARYEKGGLFSQLTYNWQNKTRLFSSGLPSTIENFPNVVFPSFGTFDFTLGADINDNFRMQAVVVNATDKNFAGDIGLFNGAFVDQIGRRFQLSATIKY